MNFSLDQGISVLDRTPATFRALLAGLPESWTTANEGPDTFSAYDNVAHLIHGERTDWIPRAKIILSQSSDRRFEPYDRFAQIRESQGKSLGELLDEFDRMRMVNLETLRSWSLDERDFKLEAEHPELGAVALSQLPGRMGCTRSGAHRPDGPRNGETISASRRAVVRLSAGARSLTPLPA